MTPDFRTEFPDYPADGMPVLPAGFVDCSWHNDTCPSFFNETLGLYVFIDYPDREMREFPECPRFSLSEGREDGIDASLLVTDSWDEILAFIDTRAVSS